MTGLDVKGKMFFVSDLEDFIDLVCEFMGRDSANYLRESVDALQTDPDYEYIYDKEE